MDCSYFFLNIARIIHPKEIALCKRGFHYRFVSQETFFQNMREYHIGTTKQGPNFFMVVVVNS